MRCSPWTASSENRTFFLRPLIPLTMALILGMGAGFYLPGFFHYALLLGLGLFLSIGWMVWRGRPCLLLPLLLCGICGYGALQPWVRIDLPAHHVANFVDQGKWRVKGRVVSPLSGDRNRIRFIILARELDQKNRHHNVSGKVSISTRGEVPVLHVGDAVLLQGHLRPIRSFCNPGGFDYQRFMALKGVRTRLFAQSYTIRRMGDATSNRRQALTDLRRRFGLEMEVALKAFDPDCIAILKALILGSREGITPALGTAFSRSGVAHVLAISGLHIGLVALTAFALGVWLMAWVPALLQRGWVRRAAALFTLLPVSIYALLSGFSPSTQRAVLMTAVFLLSFWAGRRHNPLNTLAGAALIILMVYPPALFSVSFQLSFAAVWTILLGTDLQHSRRHGHGGHDDQPHATTPLWRRLRSKAAALMQISVLAILGTLPLVLIYFEEVSWLGPLMNLLVVPVVGMIVIPAGLAGVLLSPLSDISAAICWKAAACGLTTVLPVIKWVAGWPFSAFTLIAPTKGEALLFYLLLVTVLTWRQRQPKIRILTLCLLLALAAVDGGYWMYQRHSNTAMTVTALDVGQGSANLLQLPGGAVVLIDGGGFSDNTVFDVGRSVIAPLLRRQKIRTIDLMVLSHPNSDHLNGLLYLLDHFSVGSIWSNQEPAATLGYRRWQTAITRNQIHHQTFAALETRRMINGVLLEILAPPKDFLQRSKREAWRDLNNNSLVVRVSLENISLLFTGDITADAEADLVTRQGSEKLRSTILMVPHHGSRSSCTKAFLNSVDPEEGIISLGWHNWFGFPHKAVLDRLQNVQCLVWRTDLCGAIQIKTDGRQYQIGTCRAECADKEE